jgi:exopolysaccharide biosynthesis polyprenyl glycosylphosphotransferase
LSTLETREATGRLSSRLFATARREHKLVRFFLLTDFCALSVAAGLAIGIHSGTSARPSEAALWAFVTVVLVVAIFPFYRLYERDRQQIAVSSLDEVGDFLSALSLIGFGELSIGQALELGGFRTVGPVTVLLFWLFALGLLPLIRALVRYMVVPLLNTPQNTVIVGAGEVGQTIARKVRKHPEYNVRLVGFLDDEPRPLGDDLDDLQVLGGEDDLVDTIRRYRVNRVVLAFSRQPHDEVLEMIRGAGLRDVHLSIVPRYFEILAANVGVADVEGIPVMELPAARLSRLARFTKRGFDLAVTIPALVFLAPLFLVVAVAIKIDSRGPVFFRQTRMGRDNEVFRIFKFRTMVVDAEDRRADLLDSNESTGPLFKIRADPRVTRIGRRLRKWTLDELPQLLNVFKGEMSLVGPRPFVVYEDERINGWARRRLDLTPGMTGLWQVLGRNDIEFAEMVKLDYLYVSNWTLWWDIKLLIRTVPILFLRRGY